MAKVGYIFMASHDGRFGTDKEWMQQYGCVQIVEEKMDQEALRPQWKQLIANLERGDEIVLSKFSNTLHGTRELAAFIELCRIKVVRIISIRDKIDSRGELFPETTIGDVLEMFGALPEEIAILRRLSARPLDIKASTKKKRNLPPAADHESVGMREKLIVDMYNNGYSLDDIAEVSGYSSRSSLFRILNKYGVTLNRGKFSGPLGKRKKKGEDGSSEEHSE